MTRRVAISVKGEGLLDAKTDPRFGRAAAFVLVDIDGSNATRIENEAVNAAHGAGTGSAMALHRAGATDVVAERFGPKAGQTLEGLGVKTWIAGGGSKVEDVLAGLRAGLLQSGSAVRGS